MLDTSKLSIVMQHFDSKAHLAQALGINRRRPYGWGDRVPRRYRVQLETMIGGKDIPPNTNRPYMRGVSILPPSKTPRLDSLLARWEEPDGR